MHTPQQVATPPHVCTPVHRSFLNAVATDIIHYNSQKLTYYKGDYNQFELTRYGFGNLQWLKGQSKRNRRRGGGGRRRSEENVWNPTVHHS